MREAAKAGDDVVMMLGPAVFGLALHPGLEQFDLPVLVGAILRMLEGQVEEAADIALDLQVVPGRQCAPGEQQGQRIRRKGMAGAPEHIAWKLVQQDQQGQRPARRFRPGVQLAPRRREMRIPESTAEPGVEGVILGEPFAGARLFPEGDNVGRRYVCAHDRTPKHATPRIP